MRSGNKVGCYRLENVLVINLRKQKKKKVFRHITDMHLKITEKPWEVRQWMLHCLSLWPAPVAAIFMDWPNYQQTSSLMVEILQ